MPKKQPKRVQMTVNKKHRHSVKLNANGDGVSSLNDGHRHPVKNRVVGSINDHKHQLLG